MGGYNDLKAAITALIHTNDNQEITGATLQSALLSIINTIGQGSVFKGVATTSTNPGSPDADVFYIAGRPGYYPNFNLELTAGLHVIENKSGTWINTEIALDVVDAINIGGAKHVKPSQAMIIALQSVEQIPDSEGLANKMWWSTDGNLKYKQSDTVYNLGAPAYVLYYCGNQIYKWTGSGFQEIGGGGTFASGEAVSNMSIFDDGSDTEGKSSAQLAAMIPSGAVIRSLLDLISTIDTSGGAYDGSDLITTFSYDEPTRIITVKQQNRQAKTILLPLANSTNAGLMSSEDKTQLANMQNLIGKTVNSFSKSTGETGITITLVTSDGTPRAVLIPIDSELSSQSTSNLVTGAAIYNFLMSGFVYLDQDSRAYAPYTRILPLVSMGSALDNGNTPAQINTNEFRYDPTTNCIYRHNNNVQPYFMPSTSQIYLNICTGKMYKWTGSDMEEISGEVDPSTLAGKADKHAAADILTPSQWPHVMIYNIESMWGAGGTPPDYASIPVGSIYLDDSDSIDDPPYKRLFYKKTLEGTSQRIDLGAPQENTIYCHIATGKLYRWIPTQNGNDGAFQQVGGDIVLPHIGQNGNWWVGPETDPNNDTGTKAQGPKGNSVVDGDTFDIINNLTDGGEGDALSAEMGKTLMVAIQQILGALGNYAFPGGKPTIDWGGSSSVTYSVTYYPSDSKVTHTGAGDTVELGSSLEVTLGIASGNDLYVIKDSSVKVYMGGVEQSGAYNASTQKVTLAAVTGNVVIVAEAWTYVSRGLVMHLDGRNRGGTAGKWKSLVDYNSNPLYFKLENCDEQSDYVAGNGTNSKGTAFSNSTLTTPVTLLDVGAAEGTIEAAYSHAEIASNGNLPIMHNALGNGNRICLTSWHVSSSQDSENTLVMCTAQGSGERLTGMSQVYSMSSINAGGYISLKQGSFMFNGNTVATAGEVNQSTTEESKLSIFYRRTTNDQFAKYRLYALRVYSVQLTDAERAQNLAIDQKRFNL